MMEHPEALSPVKQALLAIKELQSKLHAATIQNREPVAIIGMGCRYPGAEGLAAFWQMLQSGVDATSEVPRIAGTLMRSMIPTRRRRGR